VTAESQLRASREQLWTIDPVLTELWLLLRRQFRPDACDRAVRGLLDAGVRREPILAEDYLRAWTMGVDWPDQGFSLTDRQAVCAMERLGRLRAWSYDDDFAVIRLGARRSRALDLVR